MIRIAWAPGPDRRISRRATSAREDRFRERRAQAHQPAELGLLDHQHAARPGDTGGQEAALAGQQRQLADEAARSEYGDDDSLVRVGPHDLDLALEHNEQIEGRISGLEQQLSHGDRLLAPKRSDFRELGATQ